MPGRKGKRGPNGKAKGGLPNRGSLELLHHSVLTPNGDYDKSGIQAPVKALLHQINVLEKRYWWEQTKDK